MAGWRFTPGGRCLSPVVCFFCSRHSVPGIHSNSDIIQVIAPFCAMPTLFFVGLIVIAGSFTTPADLEADVGAIGHGLYFAPASVTVVLASIPVGNFRREEPELAQSFAVWSTRA